MVTLQLLDLPDELLIIILSSLPASSILACKVSCRRLCAVISGQEIGGISMANMEYETRDTGAFTLRPLAPCLLYECASVPSVGK